MLVYKQEYTQQQTPYWVNAAGSSLTPRNVYIKLVAENIAENIGAIQLTLRLASAAMPLGCARLDIFDYGGGYECAMKTV